MSSRITTVTVSRLPWDRSHRNVFYGSGMTNSNIYSTQFNTATYAMNLTTVGSFVDIYSGQVKVQQFSETLISSGYNYIAIANPITATGSSRGRYIFAFIDAIEYINDKTSLIRYTIDDWLSYVDRMVVPKCYVERHMISRSADSRINYTEPESITIGNRIDKTRQTNTTFEGTGFYISSTMDLHDDRATQYYMPQITYSGSNRYVNGLYFSNVFDIKTAGGRNGAEALIGNYMNPGENLESINTFQGILQGSWLQNPKLGAMNSIVSMQCVPLLHSGTVGANTFESKTSSVTIMPSDLTLNGVTVKNKKVFTSQFMTICVSDNNGNINVYKPEGFISDDVAYFYTFECFSPDFECATIPVRYQTATSMSNLDNALFIDRKEDTQVTANSAKIAEFKNSMGYIKSRFNESSNYNVSSIGNAVSLGTNTINSGINAVVSAATDNVAGLVNSGLSATTGLIGAGANQLMTDVQHKANKENLRFNYSVDNIINRFTNTNSLCGSKGGGRMLQSYLDGQTYGDGTNMVMDCIKFWVQCPSPQDIRKIDEFFEYYGYAVQQVTTPQLLSRSNWNFVKTVDCSVKSVNYNNQIPAGSLAVMNSIFNGGVTLWHNVATALDYSQSNN